MTRNSRWAGLVVACVLIATGLIGGYGATVSTLGGLDWLPRSFEWPVGTVDGAITLPNGTHVVPHSFSGRVQIYDRTLKFVRGWHVRNHGGSIKALDRGTDRFDVVSNRSTNRYTYLLTGDLVGSTPDTRDFDTYPNGERITIPTAPWLLTISSASASCFTFFSGMALLGFLRWRQRREERSLSEV
jgi:hypothetical protein